jgi:hypothetical protein
MNEHVSVSNSSLPQRDDFDEVKRQLVKDVGLTDTMGAVKYSADYGMLTDALREIVIELIRNGKPRLMQLIYRVDIPERVLGRELEGLQADEASLRLTDMIINRERQKVSIRRAFR